MKLKTCIFLPCSQKRYLVGKRTSKIKGEKYIPYPSKRGESCLYLLRYVCQWRVKLWTFSSSWCFSSRCWTYQRASQQPVPLRGKVVEVCRVYCAKVTCSFSRAHLERFSKYKNSFSEEGTQLYLEEWRPDPVINGRAKRLQSSGRDSYTLLWPYSPP